MHWMADRSICLRSSGASHAVGTIADLIWRRTALSQLLSEKFQALSISLFPHSLKPKASPCTLEEGISASPPQPSGRRRTVEQTEVIGSVMEDRGISEHLHLLGELKLWEAD